MTVSDRFDIRDVFQQINTVMADPRFNTAFDGVIDATGTDYVPSTEDIRRIVDILTELKPAGKGNRVAIIAENHTAFGMARMLSLMLDLEGIEVEAFQSRDTAEDWLFDPERAPAL